MQKYMLPINDLTKSHKEDMVQHLIELTPEARRMRFGMKVSDDFIRHYVDTIDFGGDGLFGIFNDDLVLVAFAHVARARRQSMVEFGVSVLPKYQGRGYGSALFEKSEHFARNSFIHQLYVHCLRENEPMMKMARRAGMKVVIDMGEADAYLELPKPDAASLTEDFAQHEYAVFDLAMKQGVHNLELMAKNWQTIMGAFSNSVTSGRAISKNLSDEIIANGSSTMATLNQTVSQTVNQRVNQSANQSASPANNTVVDKVNA